MREQGSPDPPKPPNHDSAAVSDVLRLLEASKFATDADQPFAASRSTDDSATETVSSHLATSSLNLSVDDVAQQLLDGLVLGGGGGKMDNSSSSATVTPRIDAALSRMVGSQALSSPSEPPLPSLHALSRTAPVSPAQPTLHLSPGSSGGLMPLALSGGGVGGTDYAPSLVNSLTLSPGHVNSSGSSPLQQGPPGGGVSPSSLSAPLTAPPLPPADPVLSNIRAFSDAMLAQQQAQLLRAGIVPLGQGGAGVGPTARLSSVEMMVEVMQRLPRRESAVPHVAPHLYHLDKQGFAALLKMLGKAGLQHRAFEIFDWVIDQVDNHGVTSLSGLSDCYTYTTIISLSHGSREVCRRGMKYFADMRRRNVQPNVFTYTALMSVCMKANEVETVGDIYEDFCEAGFQPSVVTNKIAIEAYCRTRKWDKAYQAFARIEARDAMSVEPRIYVMVIMALGRTLHTPPPADCPTIALQLSEHLRDQSRFPKQVSMAIVYTNMVTVFARVGMVDVAEQFFSMVPPQHLTKSAVSQIALAYQTMGMHERASMVMQQFSAAPPRPHTNPHNRAAAQTEQRNNMCNSWQGTECFYELLHGECRYSQSHHYGIPGGQGVGDIRGGHAWQP